MYKKLVRLSILFLFLFCCYFNFFWIAAVCSIRYVYYFYLPIYLSVWIGCVGTSLCCRQQSTVMSLWPREYNEYLICFINTFRVFNRTHIYIVFWANQNKAKTLKDTQALIVVRVEKPNSTKIKSENSFWKLAFFMQIIFIDFYFVKFSVYFVWFVDCFLFSLMVFLLFSFWSLSIFRVFGRQTIIFFFWKLCFTFYSRI